MEESRKQLFEECRQKLIKTKEEHLNGLRSLSEDLTSEINGDEGDIAQALQQQHTSLVQRKKMMQEIREIDAALQRLEDGSYGICEETEEPIEKDRLLAIPWTRLSLTGAEILERNQKRYALK